MAKLGDKLGRINLRGMSGAPAAVASVERSSAGAPSATQPVMAEASTEGAESSRVQRIASLRAQLEALRHKPAPERRLTPVREPGEHGRALPGVADQTAHGLVRRQVTVLDADHQHGSTPVALALEACARELALLALDPALETVDFARAIYIDTETTGLLGGAGTLPFLIGAAWFDDGRLVVEQMLLERPGLEGPMLGRLAELLVGASCIVSYNGKSFDWPLLRTRFILNRIAAPKLPAHLDLLHCARRVYKRRLGAVRLLHLEQAVLGFERVDDLPGELIPETYLGYLRGRVPGGALARILEHNRSDLVALAAILGELVRRFRGEHREQDARDQLGFACVAARGDDPVRAIALAQAAAEADLRGELAPEALYLAGTLKLRGGDVTGAIAAFSASVEAAAARADLAARAHLALAKLYEHKLKVFERALKHAAHTAHAEGDESCARRVARLNRKGRSAKAPLFDESG